MYVETLIGGSYKECMVLLQASSLPRTHVAFEDRVSFRGPKDHINIRISHSGSEAHYEGIPEIQSYRILRFMWPFGALSLASRTQG